MIGLTKRLTRLKLKESKMQEESLAEDGPEEARVTLPSLESTLNVWCSVVGLDKEGRNGHLLITAESTTQPTTSSSSSQGRGPSQVDDKSSLKIKSFSTGTISMSGGGGEGWPCQSCTYLNSSKTWRCEMCRADRVPLLLKAEASKRSSLDETFDIIRTKRRGQSLSENTKKCSKDSEEQTPQSRHLRQVVPLSPRSMHSVSVPVSSTRALMSDDQIDCFFFKLQDSTDRYQPPVVVMIGRRVGDMRMGKNLLIGNLSSLLTSPLTPPPQVPTATL